MEEEEKVERHFVLKESEIRAVLESTMLREQVGVKRTAKLIEIIIDHFHILRDIL